MMATEKTGIGENGTETRIEADSDAIRPRGCVSPLPSDVDVSKNPTDDGADDLTQARNRMARMRFNAVKEEIRRAELAFLSAKRVLPEGRTRIAAQRIADAFGRCGLSIYTVETGLAAHFAVEALEGVSKFYPVEDLVNFVRIGGRSLTRAARDLACCGVASIEYWGRQLQRLAEEFET